MSWKKSAASMNRFCPTKSSDMVRGSAFSRFHKALALCMSAALVYWVPQTIALGDLSDWTEITLFAFLFVSLFLGLVYILICETNIDEEHIGEAWLFSKRIKFTDVSKCKLICVPGLTWLIAPRLVLQCGGFNTHIFRASDPRVLAQIKTIFHVR